MPVIQFSFIYTQIPQRIVAPVYWAVSCLHLQLFLVVYMQEQLIEFAAL